MRFVPLSLAALCLVVPAAAQDGSEVGVQRTPESAQKFLGEFFRSDNTASLLRLMRDEKGNLSDYYADRWQPEIRLFDVSGKVRDWVPVNRCRSAIQFLEMRALFNDKSSEFYDQPLRNWSYDLDWSKVVDIVRHDTGAISFKTTKGRGSSPFKYRMTSAPATDVGSDKTVLILAIKGKAGPTFFFNAPQEADRVQFAFAFLKDSCALQTDTGF